MLGFSLVFLCSGVARADDLDQFLIARDSFSDGEFAIAAQRFRTLVEGEHRTGTGLVEPSRKYLAAALFAMNDRDGARQVFEDMLRINPDADMSRTLFSTPLGQFFYDIKQEMLPELNRLREQHRREEEATQARRDAERQAQMALLRGLATREVVRNRLSLATVFIPFGGAQFAAGNIGVGVTFAAVETLSLAAAITSAALCPLLVVDVLRNGRGNAPNCPSMQHTSNHPEAPTAQALIVTNLVSWSIFGTALAGGLVHAILTYRAERIEVRPRPAPAGFESIRLAVTPMPGPNASPGLSLSFRF